MRGAARTQRSDIDHLRRCLAFASVFLPKVRAWQRMADRYTDDELRLIVGFYGQMEEVLREHIGVLRDSAPQAPPRASDPPAPSDPPAGPAT